MKNSNVVKDLSEVVPVTLYGASISYFTGKLENYFRLKGIPYNFHPIQAPKDSELIATEVGVYQLPAVKLANGQWMTDSTKIIQWFEALAPRNPIIPKNPVAAFICLLLEDYADEWLWRPAMHYRWHYPVGATFASTLLAEENMKQIPLPRFARAQMIKRRQRRAYTVGDGIRPSNIAGVEQVFLRNLAVLQDILSQQRYILGDHPSLADIGFSGAYFRHFALDPVPLEIMRQKAPAVLEWVARLWNTNMTDVCPSEATVLPSNIGPILDDIGLAYLPYLCANADAVAGKKSTFDIEVGAVSYAAARSSRYRVWCLLELRSHYRALADDDRLVVKALLERHHCWEPLWRNDDLERLDTNEHELPFRAAAKMLSVNE